MPKNVDWSVLREYESEDSTSGSQELACSAGSCEIVDLTSNASFALTAQTNTGD